MPLFEVETEAHIIITWASDEDAASHVVHEAYPGERVLRLTKRPRDTWVISKTALGITQKILTRFEWQRYPHVGGNGVTSSNVNVLAAGAFYRF